MSDFVNQFWSSTIGGLAIGSIYALVALGYTLVYGVLRLINFAHSEIFMIGTFGAVLALSWFDLSSPLTGFMLVFVLLVAALAGMVAAGGSAVVLERIAYRPLRKRGTSRLAALISAIGASLFLQELFAARIQGHAVHLTGRDYVNTDRVMEKKSLLHIGDGVVRSDQLLVFASAIVMMVVLDVFVNRTRLGRGIRATAQDSESAVLMGIDIDRVVMLTFLIGGAMAGLAGTLYVVYFEQTKNIIGFVLGIKAFTAAVLGGIGNLRGALLGGLAIGLVENYGASITGAEWKDVITFSILVLVLLFRPTGLLGEALGRSKA
ncbi:amino acid/amide ABC transporter membrane protein 1 (HAAT family) [Motilibacter rhizosphaerae]|uniref:Amino acid/amide ABC transporter membrane protein 1 (HAAT family) n=1 Tax=Motilibacter rhizosphaerae TaxID=598652 RepID=A0A4Q7NGB5_9ACTN|nr:branched-chain amino acid ABC transporter permease [Motilibacter rhizosphaerae]RZS82865.1 amino acid/amide ABC transporter membrane protein 1 (HAAT family) [Motilibacter rhizosphaerae]